MSHREVQSSSSSSGLPQTVSFGTGSSPQGHGDGLPLSLISIVPEWVTVHGLKTVRFNLFLLLSVLVTSYDMDTRVRAVSELRVFGDGHGDTVMGVANWR